MSQTGTRTSTYSVVDIETVMCSVKADLSMIASSTGAWTPAEAEGYAHDIELLAKAGYLAWVDVTLLSHDIEQKAVRFDVNTEAGSLTSRRPGGVLWPRVPGANLRLILGHTNTYTAIAREAMQKKTQK